MSAGETHHLSTSYTKFLLENGSEHLVAQIVMNMQLQERPEIMGRSPREVSSQCSIPSSPNQPVTRVLEVSISIWVGSECEFLSPVYCRWHSQYSCCVMHLNVVLRLFPTTYH